jgi:hypothetical protein
MSVAGLRYSGRALVRMTNSQEEHLARIKTRVCELMDSKYRKGAVEHSSEFGGELLNVPVLMLVDHALEEAIDQLAYLLSVREKLIRERALGGKP